MDKLMNLVVRLIGIVFVVVMIVYLVKPDVMKWLMESFQKGKRLYFAGLIRFVLAIVFLLAATKCNKPKVIGAFGILFTIGGLLIFVIPLEKLKAYIGWWQKRSVLLLRVMTIIGLAIGAIIIYSA